jgi:alpha-D-xyloside xylohydrolase
VLAGALLAWLLPWSTARAAGFFEDRPDEVRLHNGDATLVIARAAWRMALLGADGSPHFREELAPEFSTPDGWSALGAVVRLEPAGDAAVRLEVKLSRGGLAQVDVSKFGPNGFRILARSRAGAVTAVRGATKLGVVEEVYGFGEMWNGHVAQRGQAFDLWDKGGTPDECAYMPYYVSTANYAFFMNYGGKVHFDVGRNRADRIAFEAPASELDLTLVSGASIANTVENFLRPIGLPRRPPRWAFQPWFW